MKDETLIKSETLTYYDKRSRVYSRQRDVCFCRKFHNKLHQGIVARFLEECAFVLDAGCATGRMAIMLSKSNKQVVAFDYSMNMLLKTKENARGEGLGNVPFFVRGDVEHLPFKDASFDGVVSIAVLRHFVRWDRAVSGVAGVLKKNGFFLFDNINEEVYRFLRPLTTWLRPEKVYDKGLDKRSLKELLGRNRLGVDQQAWVLKFPAFVYHLLLCQMGFRFLEPIIQRIELLPFGGRVFVRCVKV